MGTPNHLFNDEIEVYRSVDTVDHGSVISTFELLSVLPSMVQPLSGDEAVKAGREFSMSVFKVYIDVEADVLKKDEVKYSGDTYDIIDIETYPRVYKKLIMEKTN